MPSARRGRAVTVDIEEFAESLAGEEAPAVQARDVERALGCLTDGQRPQVVSAISLEGHSIAETATRLGMKENAVRVALHRGLATIARALGKTDT